MHSPEKDPSSNFAFEAARKRLGEVDAGIALMQAQFGHLKSATEQYAPVEPKREAPMNPLFANTEIDQARNYIDALYEETSA